MNYPYQQNQYYRPMQPQQQFPWGAMVPSNNSQVRPVSSIEEVRASSIDFDGSIFYFPDVANKKIYTKSINNDGTVNISVYELKPTDLSIDSSYITRKEFENVINDLIKMFESNKQEMSQPAAQQSFNF